jgi:hypothetical protein
MGLLQELEIADTLVSKRICERFFWTCSVQRSLLVSETLKSCIACGVVPSLKLYTLHRSFTWMAFLFYVRIQASPLNGLAQPGNGVSLPFFYTSGFV